MQRIGVFYATKEGQARKVAERVGAALQARTLDVAVHNVKDADADAALVRSDAAVLVGSVYLGKHEPELVAFVKAHREHDGHVARLRLHRLGRARRVLAVSRGRAARTMTLMKAAICTRYGPPEVLLVRKVEKPQPRADEVLVRIHASTVNSSDWFIRSGIPNAPAYTRMTTSERAA